MINYNIRKIIFDRVALNQWIDRIKTVNQVYHKMFRSDDSGGVYIVTFCNHCNHYGPMSFEYHECAYNWRMFSNHYQKIYRLYKYRCENCGMNGIVKMKKVN